ncbi:MAG: signal transduction histidine kinase/ligand-binding sensor domain-containing protein [Flammeovirgaceae bacterium]|jgi:signal transduction histidine kinase/ligand-binding sensor domain-containing protein
MNYSFSKALLIVGLLLPITSLSHAQGELNSHFLNPNKSISQYTLKAWAGEDGLPSTSVTDILQVEDKYIWIGTYNGLVRFDGINFVTFNTANTPTIQSNGITSLDSKGDVMWITTHKGIVKYKNHVFSNPEELSELSTFDIEKIKVDSKDRLWIGTTSKGLYMYDGKRLSHISHPKLELSPIESIEEDSKGVLWLGTDLGDVFKIEDDNTPMEVYPSKLSGGVSCMYLSKSGVIWIGSKNGLLRVENGKIDFNEELDFNDAGHITEDSFGNIWLANNNGVYRHNITTGQIEHFSEEQGLPSNLIRKLLFDHQGNLWIASYHSGLFQLTDGIFTCFSESEGMRNPVATTIIQYDEDTYWIGLESNGIEVLKNGEISPLKLSGSLPNARLKDLMKDKDGFVWVSTYGGIIKISSDGVVQPLPKALTALNDDIRITYQDQKGNIWIGTKRNGLYKYNWQGVLRSYNTRNGLSSNYIMSLDEGANGELLVGTKNGLSIIRDGEIKKKIGVNEGLPTSLIFDILVQKETLWICTDLGLCKYDKNGDVIVFNMKSGFHEEVFFDIIDDGSGSFWLSTNSGIVRVSKKVLNSFEKGEVAQITYQIYDKSDGMKSEQCVGATKMLKDSKGKIWIPTMKGMASILPKSNLGNSNIANPFIEQITIEDSSIYIMDNISINSDQAKRLSINFTAFDYVAPGKTKFKYKLKPFDDEWQFTDKLRTASYTNLPAGNYTFQAMVGNHYDKWNDSISEIKFRVKPNSYETWWFYLGCLFIFLGLVYQTYKVRLQTAKRREMKLKRVVTERTQEIILQKQELEDTFEELKQSQSQVVQSEKMASLGQMTAGIAHEINNPINFVYAGAESLKIQLTDLMEVLEKYEELEKSDNPTDFEQHKKSLQEIKEEIEYVDLREDIFAVLSDVMSGASRTAEIVKSLKVFARDDSTEFRPNDIHEILTSALIVLRSTYKGRVEIIKQFEEVPAVSCGAGKIGQVFTNIINNAIQAIDGKGEITISTSKFTPSEGSGLNQDKKYVMTSIADNGSGIPLSVIEKMFDPFYTTKDVGEGTGLGLSISQEIIVQHNGKIEVDSELGVGTTFKVYLPVA